MNGRIRTADTTRSEVWQAMVDLEQQVRYYGRLADQCARRYRTIRYGLLLGVLTEGAFLWVLQGQPVLAWTMGGAGAAGLAILTIVDAVTNYAEAAATLRCAQWDCDELKTEAKRLWRDIETKRVDQHHAEDKLTEIADRKRRATRRVTMKTDHRMSRKAAQEADQMMKERYGP